MSSSPAGRWWFRPRQPPALEIVRWRGGMIACAGSCGCGELLCAIVTGHMQMEALEATGSRGAGELGCLGIPIDKPRLNLRASQLSPGFCTKKRVLSKGAWLQMGFNGCRNSEIADEYIQVPLISQLSAILGFQDENTCQGDGGHCGSRPIFLEHLDGPRIRPFQVPPRPASLEPRPVTAWPELRKL